MPTIAFVSPKGGAGKTTSAFLLSAELAKLYDVTLIDADPNHPVQTWAAGGNTPPRLTIMSDANEASRAIRVVLQSQKMTGKPIPYAVLLTRTSSSIRTRGLAHIQNGLIGAGIRVLETELNERDAFKAVFSFQQTLDGLSAADVPNLDKAKLNVLEFTHEILEHIAADQGGRKEDQDTANVAGAA